MPKHSKSRYCSVCGINDSHTTDEHTFLVKANKLPTPLHSKYSSELEDLMLDLVLVGLPKDCAMVGDKLISPPREKVLRENRGKQWDEAEKALTTYINKEKAKAELVGRIDELDRVFNPNPHKGGYIGSKRENGHACTIEDRQEELEAQLSQGRSDSE